MSVFVSRNPRSDDTVRLPLPQDVPMSFRVLPEFILEDVIDYFLFIVR